MKSDDRVRFELLSIALAGLLIRSKLYDGVKSIWGKLGVINLPGTGVIIFDVTHSAALFKFLYSTAELIFKGRFSADLSEL